MNAAKLIPRKYRKPRNTYTLRPLRGDMYFIPRTPPYLYGVRVRGINTPRAKGTTEDTNDRALAEYKLQPTEKRMVRPDDRAAVIRGFEAIAQDAQKRPCEREKENPTDGAYRDTRTRHGARKAAIQRRGGGQGTVGESRPTPFGRGKRCESRHRFFGAGPPKRGRNRRTGIAKPPREPQKTGTDARRERQAEHGWRARSRQSAAKPAAGSPHSRPQQPRTPTATAAPPLDAALVRAQEIAREIDAATATGRSVPKPRLVELAEILAALIKKQRCAASPA